MDCRHKFIGHADGVRCKYCGLSMTAREYQAFCSGGKAKEDAGKAEAPQAAEKAEVKKTEAQKKAERIAKLQAAAEAARAKRKAAKEASQNK